jgi:hypothetical protein
VVASGDLAGKGGATRGQFLEPFVAASDGSKQSYIGLVGRIIGIDHHPHRETTPLQLQRYEAGEAGPRLRSVRRICREQGFEVNRQFHAVLTEIDASNKFGNLR